MELLFILKAFLFVGTICYMITILTILRFIKRHSSEDSIRSRKKEIKKEIEKDGRETEQ